MGNLEARLKELCPAIQLVGIEDEIKKAVREATDHQEYEWMAIEVVDNHHGIYIPAEALETFGQELESGDRGDCIGNYEQLDEYTDNLVIMLREYLEEALGEDWTLYFGTNEGYGDYGLMISRTD